MICLDPQPGSHLDDAIRVALDVVSLTGEDCAIIFNGRFLRATSRSTKADLLNQWEKAPKEQTPNAR